MLLEAKCLGQILPILATQWMHFDQRILTVFTIPETSLPNLSREGVGVVQHLLQERGNKSHLHSLCILLANTWFSESIHTTLLPLAHAKLGNYRSHVLTLVQSRSSKCAMHSEKMVLNMYFSKSTSHIYTGYK